MYDHEPDRLAVDDAIATMLARQIKDLQEERVSTEEMGLVLTHNALHTLTDVARFMFCFITGDTPTAEELDKLMQAAVVLDRVERAKKECGH